MVNTFANGLRLAAQKRPVTKLLIGPKPLPSTQPVMPRFVTDQQPAPGLNPRPPTESGIPTQTVTSGVQPVTPQTVRPPSLIQDTLRRRRELEI